MAVPKHFRFVFRGVFLNTPEEWSYSIKGQRVVAGEPDPGVDDINQTALLEAANDYHTSNKFDNTTQLTDIRVYAIGTNNKMEGEPLILDVEPDDVIGAGGAPKYGTDTALVVSLVGATRGPGRFGRFYMPGVSNSVGTDHRVSEAGAEALRDTTVAFLKAVSDSIDLPGLASADLLNISAKGVAGASQVIDHIRVGRVLDHVSRRRRSMVEDYVESGTIDW